MGDVTSCSLLRLRENELFMARQLGPKGVALLREIAESVYVQYRRRSRNLSDCSVQGNLIIEGR
jgi:hypothetical protein